MDNIFMNSENKNDNRLLLRLPDKRNLKGSVKYVALSNLLYTQKNIKNLYAPTFPDIELTV